VCLGHPLLHHLPRGVQVGARLEGQVDRGQPGHRGGVDAVQPGHAVEQVLFERDGDELLDLGRGQAERLGLYLHRRGRELGIDVDGRGPQLGDAEHHDAYGQRHGQAPEPQARAKNPAHIGTTSPSAVMPLAR